MRKTILIAAMALACTAAAEPTQVERDDLIAQQGMLRAADAMVSLTMIQILLAVVGTIALFVSLQMTRRALAQTDASLQLARNATQAELRPYLQYIVAKYVIRTDGNAYGYEVKNFGVTPARNVRWLARLDVVDGTPTSAEVVLPERGSIKTSDIAPGSTQIFYSILNEIPVDDMMRVIAGQASLSIEMIIDFQDSFGNDYAFRISELIHGNQLSTSVFNSLSVSQH